MEQGIYPTELTTFPESPFLPVKLERSRQNSPKNTLNPWEAQQSQKFSSCTQNRGEGKSSDQRLFLTDGPTLQRHKPF